MIHFQFFVQHDHPIELKTNEMIDSRLNYNHQNPVKAGFVEEASDWRYHSARDYQEEKEMIDRLFLE